MYIFVETIRGADDRLRRDGQLSQYTAISVQLLYNVGHSLLKKYIFKQSLTLAAIQYFFLNFQKSLCSNQKIISHVRLHTVSLI